MFWSASWPPTRGNRLVGGGNTGDPAALRGREVAARACFAGEVQAAVNRRGQGGAAIRDARQRVRIGAARKRIGAPAMHMNWFYSARESAAEQIDEFRHREIEEGALALRFQI